MSRGAAVCTVCHPAREKQSSKRQSLPLSRRTQLTTANSVFAQRLSTVRKQNHGARAPAGCQSGGSSEEYCTVQRNQKPISQAGSATRFKNQSDEPKARKSAPSENERPRTAQTDVGRGRRTKVRLRAVSFIRNSFSVQQWLHLKKPVRRLSNTAEPLMSHQWTIY